MDDKKHPAISAYQALRRQESNAALLHFALAQQIWIDVRGSASERPSEYSLVWLRAMSAAFVIAHNRDDPFVEVMEGFEKQYRALAESTVEGNEPRMRRTRWAGNVVPLFSENSGGNRQ